MTAPQNCHLHRFVSVVRSVGDTKLSDLSRLPPTNNLFFQYMLMLISCNFDIGTDKWQMRQLKMNIQSVRDINRVNCNELTG